MDSYSSHCERMSTVDLHPLSLPISRLSPAKSNSSIVEQLAHHQHGKGDSAYSSFSGGSTAPDYPSPFLPDDVQSSPFSHYAEYVKSCYHPTQVLQSDSKTMDQLYRSVEAISQQYCNTTNANHHSYNGNESQDMHLRTQSQSAHTPAHPPPVPTRLDSFIATKNFENSRAPHHGTEFQALQQQSQQQSKSHNRFHSQNLNYPKYEAGCPEIVRFNSEPLYSVWRGSQQQQPQAQHPPVYRSHLQPHDQSRLNPEQPFITDNKAASELQKSASILSRSPPRGMNQIENLMPKQHLGSAGCNGNHHNKSRSYSKSERKRAHSVHNWRSSEPTRAASPRSASQSFTGSSIQHKGQFYFVTGVCKQSESGLRTHSTSVNCFDSGSEVSTLLDTHSLREKERCHSTLDNLFRPFQENSRPSGGTTQDDGEVFNSVSQGKDLIFKSQDQENHRPPSILVQSSQSFNEVEEMDMMHTHEIGRHTASNPIFYCGPDKNCPPLSATHQREASGEHSNYNKKEDYATRGKQQPLGDLANEKINKETTPLLYHLTGASRAVLQPKQDPGFAIKGNEVALNKTDQGAVAVNERPEQVDTNKSDRDVTSIACNALDDSFQKYYKEKLKDAQCKVLRETSFKRRDLQLPWQHCMEQKPEVRPTVIHSFSSSQDSETSTTTLTPSVATEDTEKGSIKEELWENQKETDKVTERENRRPANVAQPQVARIGGRKRLTQEQKKMSFSEPEKLNQLGGGPVHSACRSFGNESDHLFAIDCEEEEHDQQGEQGLVAVRRKMFEIRGRTLSASSTSKTNLKHLQQKALVEYMERKTGQKVAEPQEPVPKLPPPSRQRHSLGEKPFDWGPHTLSSYNEGKITKKKHNRPHSAGRILDSSSSSIRYAQFFSAQSCSGQYAGQQSSSRKRENQGPSQGKSASAESLLDQREPTNFYRNRSISTPHTFQAHDHEENLLLANTMETQSSQKNEAEESSVKQLPQGQQHARKVAQRGKSMEELGASKLTKLSALSKSSEHLDKLWKNSTEPGGPERCASYFVDERKVQQRDKQMDKEPENLGQKSIQGQTQNPTPKKSVLRQNSELDEKATQRKKSFSRSNSPSSSSTSGPGSHVPITDELRSNKDPSETFSNPPSPRGHNISEKEMKSTSSTPIRTKPPNENIQSSRSEREQLVDEPSSETQPPCSKHEVSLSCGVTTDPSLWILPPDEQIQEEVQTSHLTNGNFDDSISSILPKLKSENFLSPCTSVSDAVISQQVEEQKDLQMEAEVVGEKEEMDEKGAPEGETKSLGRPVEKPKWEELVEAVVRVDQSLARVLCPVSSRKTALMLMEQLLSEDTVLMEEHYKKKQELKGTTESTETAKGSEPSCHPPSDDQKSQCSDQHSKADVTEKKHLLLTCIKERLRCLEESRSILQMEIEENAARGEALKLLVHEYCLPVELERYNLFIGDLERVVNLLLCLSARLARVQNALSIVDKHTDAEEKESLDSRHRLLCKQREDAKDLKDNLDRRENLVSTFLSRQLSAEQLQVYRRFIQTKASLLIRQKDLEEKQKLGEEQLEALSNSLNL